MAKKRYFTTSIRVHVKAENYWEAREKGLKEMAKKLGLKKDLGLIFETSVE